jgi:hypothetical protein
MAWGRDAVDDGHLVERLMERGLEPKVLWPESVVGLSEDHPRLLGFRGQEELTKAWHELRDKRRAIDRNKGLNDVGRKGGYKRAAVAALTGIDTAKIRNLDPLTKVLAEATRDYETAFGIKGSGELADALREQEVRGYLVRMSTTDRNNALSTAIKTGDKLVINAFFQAPAFLGLMNPKVARETKKTWLRTHDPALLGRVQETQLMHVALHDNFENVYRAVGHVGGIDRDQIERKLAELPAPIDRGEILFDWPSANEI